jgi:hypothetical protein
MGVDYFDVNMSWNLMIAWIVIFSLIVATAKIVLGQRINEIGSMCGSMNN